LCEPGRRWGIPGEQPECRTTARELGGCASSAPAGSLLVADSTKNTIWKVTGPFVAGQIITQLPSDSSVIGLLGIVDVSDATVTADGFGTVAPFVIGMGKPTGLIWLPGP